jgi:hypothetical protein
VRESRPRFYALALALSIAFFYAKSFLFVYFFQAELAKARGSQVEATWGGQQARSYILSPYRLVKDHRVGTLLREHGSNSCSKSNDSVGNDGESNDAVLGTVSDNDVDDLLEGGSPLDDLLTDVLQAHATARTAADMDDLE